MKTLFAIALALSLPLAASAQAAPPAEAPKQAAEAPKAAPAFAVTPYGIVAFEIFRNSGYFLPAQDYPTYAFNKNGGAYVAEAKQSRFGVNAAVGDDNLLGAALGARIEFDFMGPAATSWNSAVLRLRHAYVTADWAMGGGSKLYVLAGQSDALVNALHPESVTYLANPLFQQAGNLHRRTPQLRAGYLLNADAVAVKLEASVGSPADAGTDNITGSTSSPVDLNSGNRSGMPEVEARAGITMKPVSDFGGTLGVSYHTNQRTYSGAAFNTNTLSPTQTLTASLVGVDLDLALTQYLGLKGEYYTGKGIDDGFNGIANYSVTPVIAGSTVATAGNRKLVESSGYWAQLAIKPVPVLWILVGLGQEKVDNATYLAPVTAVPPSDLTNRLQNDMIHAGLQLNASKAWKIGLEWVQTTTKTRAATAADPSATLETTASQYSLSTQFKF